MPNNPIDISQVKWDEPPAIDASKVQWDDVDVAVEEPPAAKSVASISPSTALLGRGTQESSLQGLGLPVMNENVPKTGATPEKRVTVNTPFGQSSISADAPITKLGVEINKQVKSDGGDGYFDSFKIKQPQVEGSLVGDFSGSTAVKVQGKSGITGRINAQKNPEMGMLGDQGRIGATDKEVSTERERIASQVYNEPSLRDIVKVEKNGDRLIDPSKLNGWFDKYQKENGLEYLDANDKVYIRNKLYQSVADEKTQEKVLDEVKKSYSVEGKIDPITATNFVNELMPDIERQVSEKIVGELQGFADGLNAKVQSGAITAEQASKQYDDYYALQSGTMYPKLMKERGDKLAEHYGLNEEAKKEFSKRYAEQAEKRALDENMGAYEFWKNQGWNGVGAGLTKGMGDVVKLAGDALMMSGYEDLGQQISQTAKSQNLPDVQLPEFSAESLTDPVWWNTKMIPTLPLMAEMIVPSLMTQGATAGALSTIGIKGLTNLLASGTAAGVTNRTFESFAEGASQYANDIDKGLSPEIAAQHAADVTRKNYPLGGLDALQFAMLYAKIPSALKLALEGGTEYGEEVYQGWAQVVQENPEMPFLKYAATPEGIESGVLGGMMGLAFGGAGALGTQKQGSKYQKASVVYDMLSSSEKDTQKRGEQMIATLDELSKTGMIDEKSYNDAKTITEAVITEKQNLPEDLTEKSKKEAVLYNIQVAELEQQKAKAPQAMEKIYQEKIDAIPQPTYVLDDKDKSEPIDLPVEPQVVPEAKVESQTLPMEGTDTGSGVVEQERQPEEGFIDTLEYAELPKEAQEAADRYENAMNGKDVDESLPTLEELGYRIHEDMDSEFGEGTVYFEKNNPVKRIEPLSVKKTEESIQKEEVVKDVENNDIVGNPINKSQLDWVKNKDKKQGKEPYGYSMDDPARYGFPAKLKGNEDKVTIYPRNSETDKFIKENKTGKQFGLRHENNKEGVVEMQLGGVSEVYKIGDNGTITIDQATEFIKKSDEQLSGIESTVEDIERKSESESETEINEAIGESDQLIKYSAIPDQKYKIGKSPQTYTLVEKLKQTKDEIELGEQPVKVRNDKTGEEQVVLETDLTKVKSKIESAKDKLAEAKAKAKQVYDEEGKSGIAADPFKSAKRKAEADRAVFDAYVELAKEHLKAGIKKLSDFAKSIGEDISENIKNAWANANKELPDSQLKTAVAIVKNSIKGGLTKEQAIADAAKYIESTRWFAKFGSKEQSDNMTNHIAEHLSTLNDKDLEALSTKNFRKVFSNLSKSISDIASEKDFTEAKASVVENLVNYIKTNSQRFSDFDKRYFNAVLDNIKRAKTPISLGREVAKFNRSLKDFGFRDLYRNAADMRRKAKKNATKDKFGGITPDIRKFLSIDPREIPIEQLDRYIGHLEDISARAKEVNARIADIRDFNRMMQDVLDADTTTEEQREAKTEDPEFKKQVIGEVSKALKSDTFDTSNLIADEIDLVNRLKALTPDDLSRLTLPQLQQLGMMAAKLENGWLSNRVKLDILDKIDTQKQVEKIAKVAPQIFRSVDEVNTSIPDSKVKETVTAKDFFDSLRKTSLNYIDNVLRTANKIFYTNFVYPFEQGFTQVKLQDGKLQNEVKALISKLKLPFPEGILHGKKFREMNTKLSFYAKNLDWKANGGEGDLTKILLYGKDKNGNDHLRNAKISKEDKLYLREQYEALSKKYADKNGELDLEKMKADMSLGERNLLDYVKTKFETDIKPKLYFSETYNRGGSFIPQDEYNPRKILDERVTAPTADDMVSKMVDPETAKTTSSKASSTIERNQAVRFQSFDFIGDFMDTAHDAYVDYYISPIAKNVFSGLTELEKTASNKDVGKIQGLKLLLRDALLNIINTNYEKLSVPEKAINMGARIAINNMLTNLPRVFAEPASNIIGAATTVGFDYMARGMQQYTSDRKFWNELLHEANSPILNRVGRYTAEVAPVFENEIYIPNHTTKGISEKVGRVLDVLDKNEISEISKHVAAETLKFGDAVTILPTWTAAYMKYIEKQTGKPFSKETKYDAKTKQEAFAYADNIASQTHNVSSAFAQSRVIRESRQTFVKAVSWFLRGFILNDLTNFVFKGKVLLGDKSQDISRAQAAQAMAGIMAKQIVYAGIMKSLGGLMYAGISTAIGAISDDDEEEKKIRQDEKDKMIEQSKEVFTAEGLAKNAAMNLLQLATGKMNFVPMVLANNIAESANKAVTGSSYDAYKDAITYSPDLTGKILDGKLNNIGFYDIKRMLGAYGVVADRIGLNAQEINRITAKVAGDETLTDDELIKWKTMNAMFFNLQTMLSFPFSGTIQRTIQNEQRIQDGKADQYREAKVKYIKYKDLSRDRLDEALLKVKAAEIAKIKETSKAKDMALVREFQAAENEVDKIKIVAEREAKKLYSKEEKMISDMGIEKPNEDGYVMDYVQKKTAKMTPAQKKEYIDDLYEKYIISRDTKESLKILTK